MLRCFCPLQIYSLLYKLSVDLYSKDNIGENIQSEDAFDVFETEEFKNQSSQVVNDTLLDIGNIDNIDIGSLYEEE